MKRAASFIVGALALIVFSQHVGHGYVRIDSGARWPSNRGILMHLQLGNANGTLIDGATSWNTPVDQQLTDWNRYFGDGVLFTVQRNSTAAIGDDNRINNVFWANDWFGNPFGSETLAITVFTWNFDNQLVEADVVFNAAKPFNSYRGNLRESSSGGTLSDIGRVALHEFGHALGLDHPDQAGQSVTAIMNSTASNTYQLQQDDINGIRAIYGGDTGGVTINFPPRNEPFSFRQALEGKYRDGLRRQPQATFVDNEGSVVWVQEYLRYRLSQCTHQQANDRVVMQIDGRGIQPTCSTMTSSFPPRDQTLVFRQSLEAKYRDGLRRNAVSSYVDVEGDVIWISEYLRYRVAPLNCTHDQSHARVFDQIDQRGVPTTCTGGR